MGQMTGTASAMAGFRSPDGRVLTAAARDLALRMEIRAARLALRARRCRELAASIEAALAGSGRDTAAGSLPDTARDGQVPRRMRGPRRSSAARARREDRDGGPRVGRIEQLIEKSGARHPAASVAPSSLPEANAKEATPAIATPEIATPEIATLEIVTPAEAASTEATPAESAVTPGRPDQVRGFSAAQTAAVPAAAAAPDALVRVPARHTPRSPRIEVLEVVGASQLPVSVDVICRRVRDRAPELAAPVVRTTVYMLKRSGHLRGRNAVFSLSGKGRALLSIPTTALAR